VGEVVSLHTALQWMVALQFDNVDFALDSKRVVDHFKLDIVDYSEFGCTISACRQLFIDSFHNCHVEFNRRQSNEVAHELAQITPSYVSSHVYNVP